MIALIFFYQLAAFFIICLSIEVTPYCIHPVIARSGWFHKVVSSLSLQALRPDIADKIPDLEKDYELLKEQLADESWCNSLSLSDLKEAKKLIRHYRELFNTIENLKNIDDDIAMVKGQAEVGEDAEMRRRAANTYRMFLTYKQEMERSLVRLLNGEDDSPSFPQLEDVEETPWIVPIESVEDGNEDVYDDEPDDDSDYDDIDGMADNESKEN